MSFPPSFFEHLEDRLNLAVFDLNQEYREMALSPTLKGLGAKLSKFKHDVEYDAEQLSAEIDSAKTETTTVFAGAHGALASHKQDLEDVKSFVAEIAQATNGGPPLSPPAAPQPPKPHGVGPTPVLPVNPG